MKRFEKFALALAPALLLFSSAASADILIVNCGTVSGPTELTAAAILCPQFNLLGQTLSDIEITVSGGITGSITLTNGDNAPQSGSGTTTSNFSFGALTGFSYVNPIFDASFTTGLRALSAGQTLTVGGLASSPIDFGSLGHNTTAFAPYTGGGNFTIPVSSSSFFSSGGTGGHFMSAQTSNANATAVVTYTYGVPSVSVFEPATGSLLGLGLLAFGVMTRKKLSAAKQVK